MSVASITSRRMSLPNDKAVSSSSTGKGLFDPILATVRDSPLVLKTMNGALAGVVGISVVFPIDLVKTRLQNQRSAANGVLPYKGIADCFLQTYQSGGKGVISNIKALYSGALVTILSVTPEKAIKLAANDFFRGQLASKGEHSLSIPRGMVAGGMAGFVQSLITTPMELIKIQLQDQGRTMVKGQTKKSAIDIIKEVVAVKGWKGFYKGFGSTAVRDIGFSVLYFPLYAILENLGERNEDGSVKFYSSFAAGLASGAIASFSMTPLDVIKTRLQTIKKGEHDVKYTGTVDAMKQILSTEGPRALFKGAGCRVMVLAPLYGIAQMIYFIGVAEMALGIPKTNHI